MHENMHRYSFSTIRLDVVLHVGSPNSSLPFRLPLHCHHAVIVPLLSEHVANPVPSSPLDFITDLPLNLLLYKLCCF